MSRQNNTQQRNCSIDIFRYICAILIIAIHTSPFKKSNHELYYLCTMILPRIAVPFFFAVSGYYYTGKLEKGLHPLTDTIKKLIIPYSFWSFFYTLIHFIAKGYQTPAAFLFKSARDLFISGVELQLWFFPALIYITIIVTVFYRLGLKKLLIPVSALLYLVGCLGCSYYAIGSELPVIGPWISSSFFDPIRKLTIMNSAFFLCGYAVRLLDSRFVEDAKNNRHHNLPVILWCISLILFFVEIWVVNRLEFSRNIYLTLFLYPLTLTTLWILIRHPATHLSGLSSDCRVYANFTYYIHPFFISCIRHLWPIAFGHKISRTLLFLFTAALCLSGGIIIRKWNHPVINRFVS